MNLFTEPVGLRLRGDEIPDVFDDYGNATHGPGSTQVVFGWVEPRGSAETGDQQIYGYWVNLPYDAPLDAADAVVLFGAIGAGGELVGGQEYQVVGEPGRQPGGFLVEGFIKAAVERVTG